MGWVLEERGGEGGGCSKAWERVQQGGLGWARTSWGQRGRAFCATFAGLRLGMPWKIRPRKATRAVDGGRGRSAARLALLGERKAGRPGLSQGSLLHLGLCLAPVSAGGMAKSMNSELEIFEPQFPTCKTVPAPWGCLKTSEIMS